MSGLVDVHTHAFPTAQMGIDWQAIVGVSAPRRTGELSELLGIMDSAGIDQAVILLYPRSGEHYECELARAGAGHEAEVKEKVRQEIWSLNRWGCRAAAKNPRLVPFVGINVRFLSAAEAVAEIDEMVSLGARGVKIIPPSMQLYADDALLEPVFQRCWELGLPVLSQSGDGGGPPPSPGADHFGRPRYHGRVLENFPGLTLVLAHMGHGYLEDVVELTSRFPSLYTDTSLQLSGLGKPGRPTGADVVQAMRRIGVDRVLFGSNYPMANPSGYAKTLEELPLTSAERDLLASGNFQRALAGRAR